jgi:anti-anti-sigma factor
MSHVEHPNCTRFALSERNIWPGCREIAVKGELDLAASEPFRIALERAKRDRHHVLIDLSRCEFVDVHTLAILVQAHRSLDARGRQLLLCGVQGQVRRLLSLTAAAEAGLQVAASTADAALLWRGRLLDEEEAEPRTAAPNPGGASPAPAPSSVV